MSIKLRRSKFQWFLVALVIFYSGSAYAASINTFYMRFKMCIVAVLGMHMLVTYNGKLPVEMCGKIKPIWILATWAIVLFVSICIHSSTEPFTGFLNSLIHLFFVYEIITFVDWDSFRELYVRIILLLSLISLLFYYFISDLPAYDAIMPRLGSYNLQGGYYTKYRGFLFYFKASEQRNFGAFWEPGLFATHLICALMLLKSTNIRRKQFVGVILIITLLSTKSTAGYIMGVMACCFLRLNNPPQDSRSASINSLFGIFLMFVILVIYANLEGILSLFSLQTNSVFTKMLDISTSQRSLSLETCWKVFSENPIFGYGFSGRAAALSAEVTNADTVVLDTATSVRLLVDLGIMGALYTIWLVLGIMRQRSLPMIARIYASIILLLIINKEGHDQYLLSWCLMMYLNEKPQERRIGIL